MGEPQVPTTFERSAPAGSNSLAIPESEVGLPECEIPPGQNYEREKGARLPAQPSGVARELIPPPLRGAILWRSREAGGFAGV